jgi:small-conductance mechanosensitive channel
LDWLKALFTTEFASLGGAGITIALVLLLVLRVLLPASNRKLLRSPLVFLVLNVAIVVLRALVAMPKPADRFLSVLALVLILACVGRLLFVLVVDWLLGHRLRRPLPKIIHDLLHVFLYFGVAFVTLPLVGLEPGQLLTTSALLTAVIGLSLQETMGNLFAGLALQAQRPFVVGDWIKFEQDDKLTGRVTEINWRATKVLTVDDVEVIIPNGTLAKAPIQNFTQPTPVSRRTVIVQGPYEAPPLDVMNAILGGLRGCPGVLESPAPEVQLSSYADSGIEYFVRYSISDFARRFAIDSQVRVRIWYSLSRAGISIPFPIRDVRHHDMAAETKEATSASLVERRRTLSAIDFLADMPSAALDRLAETTRVALYSAGEEIIRQGDDGDELFIVHRGEVAILVGADVRRATEVARLGAGKFFGEMSLMTGEKRTATVVAAGPCELYVIGRAELREILEMDPKLPEHIADVLARRKAQLEERSAKGADVAAKIESESSVLLSRIKSFFSL